MGYKLSIFFLIFIHFFYPLFSLCAASMTLLCKRNRWILSVESDNPERPQVEIWSALRPCAAYSVSTQLDVIMLSCADIREQRVFHAAKESQLGAWGQKPMRNATFFLTLGSGHACAAAPQGLRALIE